MSMDAKCTEKCQNISFDLVALKPICSAADTNQQLTILHFGSTLFKLYGPQREKICLRRVANINCAEQPAHPRRLISAFVIHFWKVSYLNLRQAKFSSLSL